MYQLLYKNLIFLVIFALVFSWVHFIFAGTLRLDIETTIRISICGNNIIDGEEVCDGDDLAGETCQSRGYQSGNLDCNDSCDEFDVSGCYTPPAPPPPFGGGGGYTAPAETKVNFTGKAYPKSTVTLLKDAQIVATTVAGTDATFTMSLTGLSAGNYIFSVYSEDNKGNRSSLLTFPVGVTFGIFTVVGFGINLLIISAGGGVGLSTCFVTMLKGAVVFTFGTPGANLSTLVTLNLGINVTGSLTKVTPLNVVISPLALA